MKTVHVIYKTHLDIGFTDLAENVINDYIHHFIIKALDLAENLNEDGKPPKFVWTTGSWLINEYLKVQSEDNIRRMEEAIRKGYIAWHALPFTTHTELMDAELFEYGLSISKKLDRRFGKNTIAAKMTDVPGHTRAIVPILKKYGVKYLHIGVNPTCMNPDVPKLFLWRGADNSEIIVNYAATYGEVLQTNFTEDVLMFANTGDNTGPASKEQILENIHKLHEEFPNATITASTLDNIGNKLWEFRDKLPVINGEIGDTWIHGVGSDPKKVLQYRELMRLKNKWIEEGRLTRESNEYDAFLSQLIMIPEHTWALDLKKYLPDFKNYSKEDFKEARKIDVIHDTAIPDKYKYIGLFAMDEKESLSKENDINKDSNLTYSHYEKSWAEQREYISKTIAVLSKDKQKEVRDILSTLIPAYDRQEGSELRCGEYYPINGFLVKFDENGSIISLKDQKDYEWCSNDQAIGRVIYESFGVEDYDYWFKHYMCNLEHTYKWADADYNKPGMDLLPDPPKNKRYLPKVDKIISYENKVVVYLSFDNKAAEEKGCPRKLVVTYSFSDVDNTLNIELSWFNKDANRLPEAIWFSVSPNVSDHSKWYMDKMGERISPNEVVSNGNKNLHAVLTGLYNEEEETGVMIETLDAPLVAIGEPKILKFDNVVSDMKGGFYFNLYNNVWGTNFPMWYEEDAMFRFRVSVEHKK